MSYIAHTEIYKGFKIKIHQDEDPMNPLTDCDGEPDIIGWHRRYDFTTDKSMKNVEPKEFEEMAEEKGWVYLPVYMYDHSGIALSTAPFSCQWDSGQLGFIYWTKKKVEEGQGEGYMDVMTPEKQKFLEEQLRGSLKNYDDYQSGNCYGYTIERMELDEDGDVVDEDADGIEDLDSCWGYLGDYDGEYGALKEARSSVDSQIKYDEKQRKEKAAKDFPLLAGQLEVMEEQNGKS